ncbi:MAG: putative tryptophan/tyrosine transport system permease protein [Thermoanaerobacterium sp.]|jgi:Branched-chain amino acid transport system / permease component.|uniref:ABC transporter permease n=1 Tax=Thermoanaerobacterium thermosaccharolyticum TaxID=1517 RepID=UPI00264E3991|nr:putative tryptophan/tyrosine transport system permease protein [Thermoanaerobacterium sp.]MDN5317120.1 putative tryptophan/tyrosine transport system permease protein [Thermoanaerobacterium sp.]WHE06641.1 ABC transporter permease [Thermoanaerobacterium thermosaccharolyticum]
MSFAISTLEQGLVYGIMALGVYISFKIINFADLTVEGSFTLGAAVTAKLITSGVNPIFSIMVSFLAGGLAGLVTGFLNTKLKITELLAGILTMTALYSINLRIMGKSNIPMLNNKSILDYFSFAGNYRNILFFGLIMIFLVLLTNYFLQTRTGFALRATGNNQQMVRSMGINTNTTITLGLIISNAYIALAGSLVSQYQGFADAGMGIGTLVAGLASVIIGEVLFRERNILWAVISAVVGSIVYRGAIAVALTIGFNPTDLKLLTAILVVIALSLPGLKKIVISSN